MIKKILASVAIFILLMAGMDAAIAKDYGSAELQEYHAEFCKYMEISGVDATYTVAVDMLVDALKENGVSRRKIKEFRKQVEDNALPQMIELLVPIYMHHISLEDLRKHNEFYETPAGRRIAKAQPEIVKMSIPISEQLVEILTPQLQEILKNVENE